MVGPCPPVILPTIQAVRCQRERDRFEGLAEKTPLQKLDDMTGKYNYVHLHLTQLLARLENLTTDQRMPGATLRVQLREEVKKAKAELALVDTVG